MLPNFKSHAQPTEEHLVLQAHQAMRITRSTDVSVPSKPLPQRYAAETGRAIRA